MGKHRFTYALLPHEGSLQEARVIQHAYALNAPLLTVAGLAVREPHAGWQFRVSVPNLIIEAVKPAEDQPGAVLLRLFEAYGGSVQQAELHCRLPVRSATLCDLLEEVDASASDVRLEVRAGSVVLLPLVRPFKILSILLQL